MSLHQYCYSLDLEGVKYAVEHGADVNEIDDSGYTPITSAINGHWDYGEDILKSYSLEEHDTLEAQAYKRLVPIMDYLIEHGANLDLFGKDGFTPLCAAYYADSVDAIRYLLEHGANPNINCHLDDKYYQRPICSSALQLIHEEVDDDESDPEIERLLLQYGAKLYADE